jgi:hypothetical protein
VRAALEDCLRGIQAATEAGEALDHASIQALCAELTANPGRISREEAAAVIRLVDAITAALVGGREQISSELRDVRRSRSALKGYSHLRPTATAQRLRRQG